ncbi:MAG: RpiB/LacA/LacB family sugar-phosphate isomerase [Candidatus Micrarchaeaceae archaeon]
MAIYIVSEDSRLAIRASNIISSSGGSAVISEAKYSAASIGAEISEALKDYEKVLLITSSPAKYSIELNKVEGIRAYNCRSSGDFEEALEADANVIVVGASVFEGESQQASEIISEMLGAHPAKHIKIPKVALSKLPELKLQRQQVQKMQRKAAPRKPIMDSLLGKFEEIMLPKGYEEENGEKIEKQKPDSDKQKKKGFGSIKERLGVE